MEIYISEEDILQNIQNDFQEHYPYLKLVFYKNPHQPGEPSPENERLSPRLPVEEISMYHTSGTIDIGPTRTIAAVEQDFFGKLSLCVQVFRKAANGWMQTTATDNRTLQQQNDLGRESTMPANKEMPEDFDLLDVE